MQGLVSPVSTASACRSEMVNTCYSPNAMFAHPLFIVYGRPAIRGIWFFWARVMNRRIRGQVRAIGESRACTLFSAHEAHLDRGEACEGRAQHRL